MPAGCIPLHAGCGHVDNRHSMRVELSSAISYPWWKVLSVFYLLDPNTLYLIFTSVGSLPNAQRSSSALAGI